MNAVYIASSGSIFPCLKFIHFRGEIYSYLLLNSAFSTIFPFWSHWSRTVCYTQLQLQASAGLESIQWIWVNVVLTRKFHYTFQLLDISPNCLQFRLRVFTILWRLVPLEDCPQYVVVLFENNIRIKTPDCPPGGLFPCPVVNCPPTPYFEALLDAIIFMVDVYCSILTFDIMFCGFLKVFVAHAQSVWLTKTY